MCGTDRHDMTLVVKVALNPNTTNQPILQNNKILDYFKIKAHVDDVINLPEISGIYLSTIRKHHGLWQKEKIVNSPLPEIIHKLLSLVTSQEFVANH